MWVIIQIKLNVHEWWIKKGGAPGRVLRVSYSKRYKFNPKSMPVPLCFLHFKPFKLGYIPEKNSAHGWSLHSMRGLGGGEWTPDMGNRLQRQWSRSTVPVTSFCNVSHTLTHIADPPLVDLTNVVRMRSVKGYTEEFSFAGVNLIFLLIIIVLSILCLNFLIIGISVIIWRW